MFTSKSGLSALALVSLVAACAAPAGDDTNPKVPAARIVEPDGVPKVNPGPPPAPVQVGIEASGRGVQLQPGQSLVVKLLGTPTAGYLWRVVELPSTLQTPENTFESELPQPASGPPRVGGNAWEVYTFAPGAPGDGELVMHYGRPWELERGGRPERVFRVRVAVPAE